MTHATFIAMAYVVSFVGLSGMIFWILFDGKMQRKRLERLEKQGLRRRSQSEKADLV